MYKKMKKIFLFLRRYLLRNNIILDDFSRKTKDNSVNLHWWRPVWSEENKVQDNLGDYLAVPIFEYLMKYNGIKENKCKGKKHLYTVGSIIFMGLQDTVIWGSGLQYEDKLPFLVTENKLKKWKIELDIRAVRGPKTREILQKYGYDCPEIYGDPAILMPLLYNPVWEKRYEYTVIHHMYSKEADEGINIKTTDYKAFIDRIVQSKLIISGSLHGIILAETYGVPAILLKDRNDMDMFKYMDYYAGTGRLEFPVARTVEEAIKLPKLQLPDFGEMQQKLLNAFPIDLWK